MALIITVGDTQYRYTLGTDNSYVETPEGPEKKVLQVAGDNTDPANDNGGNPPVAKNPAPPAAAPIKDTKPQGGPPMETPDDSTPEPAAPQGPGVDDDLYDQYVGGKSKLGASPLPNPEGGALAPNPDNATTTPKGGMPGNTPLDSLDDHSAKPPLGSLNWYMGSRDAAISATMAALGLDSHLEKDPETGLASWPLTFRQIADDVKKPLPSPPHKAFPQDAEKDYELNKPYVI